LAWITAEEETSLLKQDADNGGLSGVSLRIVTLLLISLSMKINQGNDNMLKDSRFVNHICLSCPTQESIKSK
jgi:hypothetical protein